MAAAPNLSEMDTDKLKKLILGGSIEAMRYFGEKSTAISRNNRDELEWRKELLFQSPHNGHSHILRHVAMLAAMTEDIEMARFIVKELEGVGDPAMGYYTYREIEHHNLPEEEASEWEKLLISAAKQGHILARRHCLEKKMAQFGVLGKILVLPMRVVLLFSGIRIAFLNPEDSRLPP